MDEINLHELANAPGYGRAQQIIAAAGHWDQTAEADGLTGEKPMLFTVEVSGTYVPEVETITVKVVAKTRDEAEDLAWEQADFDDVEGTKIIKVEEVGD